MFGHIVNRTFFVIFLELPYSESQWIPSFEAIQIQLVQTLKDTFDKQPLSKLTNALELLHQRRESRIHHTTILSLCSSRPSALGIVISMNPSIFTQIDKFLLLLV